MRTMLIGLGALALLAGGVLTVATGQAADDKKADKKGNPFVDRLMAYDKNKDGKLTKDEVSDERLHRLLEMADTKKKGFVTRADLEALAAKLEKDDEGPGGRGGRGRGGPGGRGGRDGDGPPGGRGPGGRGPGGRFGGPPQPGTILPSFLVERLELTDAQKKKLASLQKEVDEKLAKILTDEQKKTLKEMRERGPGGRGPGGRGPGGRGPGGPGGPGGRGPGGPGGPGGRGPGGPPPERD